MAKYSLTQIRQKFKESHPEYPEWIELTVTDAPDARVYRIHHPLFQTNQEKLAFQRANDTHDDFEMGRALLGDAFDDFTRDGGQVSDLSLLLVTVTDTMNGVDENGNPTTR